jgi:magnesium transporter
MPSNFEKEDQQQQNIKNIYDALESGLFDEVKDFLRDMSAEDIADIIESLHHRSRKQCWDLLPDERQGEVLNNLADEVRNVFLEDMQPSEVAAAVTDQDTDDAADIIGDLPDEILLQVLESMDEQDRLRISKAMDYEEDTAGSLMNIDTVTVRPNVEIDVVLRYLRMRKELPPHTDALYVVDRNDHLLGLIPLTILVTANSDDLVADVMRKAYVIEVDLDDTEVARRFEKYDWIEAPVVNEQNQLLGRITIDDVVDVIIEDADQSLLTMAGLDEDEDTFAPALKTAPKRALWLGINLFTALLAAAVSNYFEGTFEKLATVAILMTIVPSMGGIAGNQALTIVIRGIALGHVGDSNARWLLTKEVLVGLMNGILWSVTIAVLIYLWKGDWKMGLVIAAAMMINLLVAAASGVSLPLILKKMGIDPAVAGGVILTTITDVIGLLTFLGLATYFLL